MNIQIPGVDPEKVFEQYEDDHELYAKVSLSYISTTQVTLDKIRTVSAETLADYAVFIHSIKGASTSIGAEETRKAALNLELKAKAGDLAGVLAENQTFVKNAEKLIDDIRIWLDQFDANISK